ncbi:LRR receptor-like serine/threonine-protein kinase GSO1 [Panicum miliaceum]|uniref:LRR receptor-like serine/threonine-protein kinase GSO1 n=1 Tax=Panicum miliaceum TaxID=4540 RepID=A0A3L6RSI9_PANMI|nr:LRR receptor-like serine/threonine-protein kinase GSO1 [Panicum miliaceum]
MLIDSLLSSSQELAANLKTGFQYGNNSDLSGTELPGLRPSTLADLIDPESQTGRSRSAPASRRKRRPWASTFNQGARGRGRRRGGPPRGHIGRPVCGIVVQAWAEGCRGLAVAVHGRRRRCSKERGSRGTAVA